VTVSKDYALTVLYAPKKPLQDIPAILSLLQSSLASAWYWLPKANITLPLGVEKDVTMLLFFTTT
jgi:hypothetical protein